MTARTWSLDGWTVGVIGSNLLGSVFGILDLNAFVQPHGATLLALRNKGLECDCEVQTRHRRYSKYSDNRKREIGLIRHSNI